jgi:hypothetical protein
MRHLALVTYINLLTSDHDTVGPYLYHTPTTQVTGIEMVTRDPVIQKSQTSNAPKINRAFGIKRFLPALSSIVLTTSCDLRPKIVPVIVELHEVSTLSFII